MDNDIKKLLKLLKIKKRIDLIDLFENSKSELRMMGQYSSARNSVLSSFIIYLPVEKYMEVKKISQADRKLLLGLVREIYPLENDSPEIYEIAFRIKDEDDESENNEKKEKTNESFVDRSIRIFICYSSLDNIIAGKIKQYLEQYFGFEVFLAHEDLEGGEEFDDLIVENLKSTDIFLPLLSSNFKTTSGYTDQETGMAYVLDKKIIPVSIEGKIKPYGFISKIQSLSLKIEKVAEPKWFNICEKVAETIGKKALFRDSVKNSIIRAFSSSYSFQFTNTMISLVKKFEPYNKQQVNRIIKAYLENPQIKNEGYHIPYYINEFVKKHKSEIEKNLLDKILKPEVKDISDIPF